MIPTKLAARLMIAELEEVKALMAKGVEARTGTHLPWNFCMRVTK